VEPQKCVAIYCCYEFYYVAASHTFCIYHSFGTLDPLLRYSRQCGQKINECSDVLFTRRKDGLQEVYQLGNLFHVSNSVRS